MQLKDIKRGDTFEYCIKMLFEKSNHVVIRKDKGGHAMRVWSDHDFVFYPYQAGIPYLFEMVGGVGKRL